MPEHRHRVEVVHGTRYDLLYDGTDAADAMAAWSRAISNGEEYAILESLRVPDRDEIQDVLESL